MEKQWLSILQYLVLLGQATPYSESETTKPKNCALPHRSDFWMIWVKRKSYIFYWPELNIAQNLLQRVYKPAKPRRETTSHAENYNCYVEYRNVTSKLCISGQGRLEASIGGKIKIRSIFPNGCNPNNQSKARWQLMDAIASFVSRCASTFNLDFLWENRSVNPSSEVSLLDRI